MNNNALTNVSSVNGLDFTKHAARHLPNGVDPIATAAPGTSLSASSTNAEGVANSLARSDHTHAISGFQPSSSVLTAISNLTGAGFVKNTAQGIVLDTSTYLTNNQNITLSGDVTGSGSTAIEVSLANSGVTAGSYPKVTVNAKGIVTGGSQLASTDIVNALGYTPYNANNPAGYISSSQASSANTANFVVQRDAFGNFSAGTISAALNGNAATATKLQTARTINGVSFDGTANIVFNTGSVAEGTNLYFTNARARAAISVTGNLTYDQVTGVISTASNTGRVYDGSIGVAQGTSQIPFDSTAPSQFEGALLWSQVVTPASASSRFSVEFSTMVSSSTNSRAITIALFRNGILAGFASSWQDANEPKVLSIRVLDAPNTASNVTYSMRIGISSSGTFYIGRGSSSSMGNSNNSAWTIREIL